MRWLVAFGVVALVRVLPSPFEAARRELVGTERDGPRGERACDHDRLVALLLGEHARVGGDVLRRQLRRFVGLRVDPAQWLQILNKSVNK